MQQVAPCRRGPFKATSRASSKYDTSRRTCCPGRDDRPERLQANAGARRRGDADWRGSSARRAGAARSRRHPRANVRCCRTAAAALRPSSAGTACRAAQTRYARDRGNSGYSDGFARPGPLFRNRPRRCRAACSNRQRLQWQHRRIAPALLVCPRRARLLRALPACSAGRIALRLQEMSCSHSLASS